MENQTAVPGDVGRLWSPWFDQWRLAAFVKVFLHRFVVHFFVVIMVGSDWPYAFRWRVDSRSDSVLHDYSRCRRLGCCSRSNVTASSHHSLQGCDRLDRGSAGWPNDQTILSSSSAVHRRPHSLGRHLRETVRSLWCQALSVVAAERSPLRVSAFRVRQGFALSQFAPVGGSVLRGFRGRGKDPLASRIRSFKVIEVRRISPTSTVMRGSELW